MNAPAEAYAEVGRAVAEADWWSQHWAAVARADGQLYGAAEAVLADRTDSVAFRALRDALDARNALRDEFAAWLRSRP